MRISARNNTQEYRRRRRTRDINLGGAEHSGHRHHVRHDARAETRVEGVEATLERFAEFSGQVEVRLERMEREADERRAQSEAQGYRGMRQQGR